MQVSWRININFLEKKIRHRKSNQDDVSGGKQI